MTPSEGSGEREAAVHELVTVVHRLLRRKGAMLAVAESLTGGLVAAAITERAGASDVFAGSVTAYSTAAKTALLGVDSDLLARRGAVDSSVARAMAEGARDRFGADLALATTGVAGPTEQDGRSVGTLFVAVAASGDPVVVEFALTGDRETIRRQAVREALRLLRRTLEDDADGGVMTN